MNVSTTGGLLACLAFAVMTPFAHSAPTTVSPVDMVFTSDPQYPWTEKTDAGETQTDSERDSRSKWLIETQYNDIANFRQNFGGVARVPVMINGDITAFGHGWQRSVVKPILDNKLLGQYDYGLGNHDYENNVDDCLFNNCAAGSVEDFLTRYTGKDGRADSIDVQLIDEGTVKKRVSGSLAYSKNFGDVHMVQLNNEPTYSVNFTAYDWLVPKDYHLTDALDWLEKDLKGAREKGQIIILNMHKPQWGGSDQQLSRFNKMIKDYKVTAVFAGHYHRSHGKYTSATREFGDVPLFLSGAASQQTYLIATFTKERDKLMVYRVTGNNWPSRKLEATIPVKR
ncbi:metallophosphoesterase [Pseudomonas sp. GM41(2012)]|uniref:metallophosphoesterase family protein n=1 Tax=Pseudomonas sp. (strain GM41(2012)) TaxID=1144708 RepID=UPI00026FE731|nr:metallophosphoesterase [Pseudomonas sp. GM41(2012)]EUB72606.1 metallophosphoesterase [Pseudomonas sp. GM41(2012)]